SDWRRGRRRRCASVAKRIRSVSKKPTADPAYRQLRTVGSLFQLSPGLPSPRRVDRARPGGDPGRMKLVDVRGRRCPMLLAELAQEMSSGAAGHTVEILADQQSIADSLVEWCRREKHSLVSIDVIDGDLRVFIRKGPATRPSRRVDGRTGGFPALR